jgi:hypothetical protein
MNGGSGPLRATSIAASEQADVSSSGNTPIGCAIVGGAVWCFPTGETLTDSTLLGAGLGSTDTTSSPVQVLTPTSAPLTNVTQIAGGLASSPLFCAVVSDGSVWCWGYGGHGQLGNGGAANASYATQVMMNASTPFSNAVEVRIGEEVTCARKSDGTVWCWGTGSQGEFGATVSTTSYHPVQVPLALDGGSSVATRLAANGYGTLCALMQDTTIVCWGYNVSGQAGVTPGGIAPPTQILAGAGAGPLTGAVDLSGTSTAMCAKTSGLSVLCWGSVNGTTAQYPVAYQGPGGTAALGIIGPLTQDWAALGYIDPSGVLVDGAYDISPQPTCANLLP